MIRECFKTESGILFSSEAMKSCGLDPATLHPTVPKHRPEPLSAVGAQILTIPSAKELKAKANSAEVDDLVKLAKTEEDHELLDAMSPIYDQLSLAWSWWALELLPMKQHYQTSEESGNKWATYWGSNLGSGRFIPKQKKKGIKVHRSVKMRMEAQYANDTKYIPAASFQRALELNKVEWVD
jgi:hypothetical protein